MLPSKLYQVLEALAIANVRSFESPGAFNSTRIYALRTPDAVQIFHPAQSLPQAYSKPIPAAQHKEQLDYFAAVIDTMKCDIQEITVDTEKLTALTRLTATYGLKGFGNEPAEYGYMCEYNWLLEMDPNSQKIKRLDEFLDVQRVMQHILPKADRYHEYLKTHNGTH